MAVDPGTKTGYAMRVHGDVVSGAIDVSPATAAPRKCRRAEPEYARPGKFVKFISDVYDDCRFMTLVVEGAAAFVRGKAAVRVGHELRGAAKAWAWTHGVRYVEIQPADLKKFAVGKGTAEKEEMVLAARERLGYGGSDDNEADARWLLAWAESHAFGVPAPAPAPPPVA